MKPATLRDIAQRLGVTVATVSRALKNYPDISPDTKARVLAVAREVNYAPNPLAVKLRQNTYKVVGVIIPEIVHQFFASVISGIMDLADQHDYHVMLTQSGELYRREVRETQMLQATGVDGLLVCLSNETTDLTHLRDAQARNVPVVLFDKVAPGFAASQVVVDDFQGAYEAVDHLLRQGLRRVAHIRGPEHPENAKQRLAGYRAALAAHSLPYRPEYVRQCQCVTEDEGRRFARELLALPEPPQAIFTITDLVAIGALGAIKELGLRVPHDIALIGFSNWHVATVVDPPLSSVYQPGYDMGRRAMEILLREMDAARHDHATPPEHVVLPTRLVVRRSSVLD